MRPLEFYRLGVAIAQRASTEPEHRTAVNRLYYGLHHEACCRFFRRNPYANPLNRNRRHTDLRDRFSGLDALDAQKVGALLNELMSLRSQSDYRLTPTLRFRNRPIPAQQIAGVGLSLASELLQALETYSPGEAEDGCNCPQAYSVV